MATKERLHQLVEELSDREAEDALLLLDAGRMLADDEGELKMAALPEGWGETLTGEPMPDVAAAVRRSRSMH